ncbi:indolepyruvate ferredoxin oxidoreductase beta subunit [Breoghania corrubedonensis]|uniref:Indolepyruvate ferredoxin oxidoreductase beta subunit n=1 Tax=Breoghania corrubedonensis TaxID=665038 RepID=A0A2T5VB39_9HYPH|nr:indolepyruvate oxidoreductase subunit beta family protein [Breoghania corrubedonensis]PTW60968.1 indolepyruvate ferredoxin oxidoreductase beta subunit [Breoghania corrubedonensis]
MATTRLLIAALGGEGGGVLTNWLVAAAAAQGLKAQATSVPGVAQRTGATTYYLEIADEADSATHPVFALMPVAGDVDVVVASELLEAVRMAERGFVVPDRTFLVSSTHRVLTMHERIARGDGARDADSLMQTAERASRDRFLTDFAAIARKSGAALNSVLLGAIAGRKLTPIPAEALRDAIEAGGIAVARNLTGFDAGFTAASCLERSPDAPGETPAASKTPVSTALEERVRALPGEAREIARIGVARLVDYQGPAYAALYLDRLAPFADEGPLCREVARHLAVRMSFEDIIRVAQLKTRASRLESVRREIGISEDEPFELVDFFKPGIPELADMLPPRLGRALNSWAERKGIRETAHFGMKVKTNTILGFGRIWLLAKLKPWRPRSLRFAEEQAAIDAWLKLVAEARAVSPEFALQTADLARLVKGYGDTYRRGQETYARVVEDMVRPVIARKDTVEDPAAQLKGAIAGILAAPA